jgi:hypothetical protein
MSTQQFEPLGADESGARHAFASSAHHARDLRGLEHARSALADLLTQPGHAVYLAHAPAVNCVGPEDEDHRIVLYHPVGLAAATALGFVGFCGFRADGLSNQIVDEINRLDLLLLDELLAYPDVLSYSTLRMPDDDYVNLVVLRDLDAIQAWRSSALHKQAAEGLSPRYYRHIRLHNGVMAHGVRGALTLTSTKYYDFESDPIWQGLRLAGL